MRRQPAGARRPPLSETFALGALLAAAGGFLDAYTYLLRGGVFANAQTGNIVLLGMRLAEGEPGRALGYLVPILAFAAGVAATEGLRRRWAASPRGRAARLHWRQIVLGAECAILLAVAFLPAGRWDMAANVAISFLCAMQVQAFRKVNGYAFASTMCIGNLRSGMDSLCSWLVAGNRAAKDKALHYFAIIFLFALGAALGSVALNFCSAKAIWFSCLLLTVSFCLMFLKEDVEEIKEDLEKLEAKH